MLHINELIIKNSYFLSTVVGNDIYVLLNYLAGFRLIVVINLDLLLLWHQGIYFCCIFWLLTCLNLLMHLVLMLSFVFHRLEVNSLVMNSLMVNSLVMLRLVEYWLVVDRFTSNDFF